MEFVSDGDSIATAVLGALSAEDRGVRARAVEDAARFVDPDELIDAVADHADARRRNAALDALALGAMRSVPSLIRALDHDDPEVVMFAASALGKTRDKAAVPHLLRLLEQDDVNIVQAALDSLSLLRASVAVDPIIQILDRDPWMRLAGVHALGDIGDAKAVPVLVALLEEEETRELAALALGKIRSPDALPKLAELLRQAGSMDTFLTCLRAIGAVLERSSGFAGPAHDEMWRHLGAPDAATVHMRLLAVLSGEESGGLVGADVRETKIAAATLIRVLEIDSLYTPMVLAGRDPSLREPLKFCAVSVGEGIAESLRVGISYHDKHVRILACQCAADLRLGELEPRILELLRDDDGEVRQAAARALAYVGDGQSAPRLVPRLLDSAQAVRDAARATLCRLDERAVTRALLEHDDGGSTYRIAALEVMAASPHEEQREFIVECLKAACAFTRRRAIEALAVQPGYDVVTVAQPFLTDPEPSVREAALAALARQPSGRVRDLLLGHMARDPETRETAVRAAAALSDPTVGARLVELFHEAPYETQAAIVEALAELREPAAEPLFARLLGYADDHTKVQAVRALAAYQGEMPLRHLIAAARDPSPRVRAAVAEVLCSRPLEQAREELERLSLDDDSYIATMARHRLEVAE